MSTQMEEASRRAFEHMQRQAEEARTLREDIADCSRRGVIYGIELTYCPLTALRIGEEQHRKEYTNDSIEAHHMIMDALRTGRVAHLRRASSLIEYFFIGESRPDLADVVRMTEPDDRAQYGIFTGCMSIAALPSVAFFDPMKLGVGEDMQRIEALLKDVGIPDHYIDGKVRVFSS